MTPTTLFNQNLAEVTVSYSRKVKFSDMEKISCSKDAYSILLRLWSESIDHVETFYIVLLNNANKVLGFSKISQGGMSGTVADPKVIFQIALKTATSALILAHNHPSGNTRPSEADLKLTKQLKEFGTLINIPVIDHIIVTSEDYLSLADEGLM